MAPDGIPSNLLLGKEWDGLYRCYGTHHWAAPRTGWAIQGKVQEDSSHMKWRRYINTYRRCWMEEPYDHPSHPGVTLSCWCRRRMAPWDSAKTLGIWTPAQRKIHIRYPNAQRLWSPWLELVTSPPWTSRVAFGKLRCLRILTNIQHLRWAVWVCTNFCACHTASVTCWPHSSTLCKIA